MKPLLQPRPIARRVAMLFDNNNNNGYRDEGLSFGVRLQNSLLPYRAAGSTTPTYTRATVATFTDFEGRIVPVLSGEARFQGARRVRNFSGGKTNDFTVAGGGWTYTGASNNGTANTLTYTVSTGEVYTSSVPDVSSGGSSLNGRTFIFSATITAGTATSVYMGMTDQASWAAGRAIQTNALTLTSTPRRFSVALTFAGSTGTLIGLVIGMAQHFGQPTGNLPTGTITVTDWMLEEVTGQSNQNPSEYVSVGVLSAPYHGAGVDGVRYFPYLNGNTVSSNVVTEATGAAISSATCKFASLTGDNTSDFTTLASTANKITSDIAVLADVVVSASNVKVIASRLYSGSNYSYDLYTQEGTPKFRYSPDGPTVVTVVCSAALTTVAPANTRIQLLVTRSASSGDVKFYTAPIDSSTWTQLGTTQSTTPSSIFAGTSALHIGGNTASQNYDRSIYRVRIYSGGSVSGGVFSGGTLAVDFNPNDSTTAQTWTSSTTGEVWTTNGSARVFGNTNSTYGIPAPWDAAGPFGYLAEGARTNLLPCSSDLTSATYWQLAGNVVAAPTRTGSQTDPSGGTAAVKLDFPAVAGVNAYSIITNAAAQRPTMAASAASNTWYLKGAVGGEQLYLSGTPDGLTWLRQLVTLTTNWTRYELQGTPTATAWYWQLGVDLRDASQSAKSAMTVYAAFPQVEQAAFASSYIPTTSASVTRNADVLTYPSAGNYTGPATLYGEFSLSQTGTPCFGLAVDDGSQANEIALGFNVASGQPWWTVDTASSNQGNNSIPTTLTTGTIAKFGIAVGSSIIPYANAVAGTGATGKTAPTSITTIRIGSEALNRPLWGTIRNVRIYNRQSSGARLAQLTA